MSDVYGTTALAEAYHIARGDTVWAAAVADPDSAREAALLRASVWIDATYRPLFPGYKTGTRSQVREWPRTAACDVSDEIIPSDEVPREILEATYEAALAELTTPGILSPAFTASQQVKSETIGPISVTYQDSKDLADVRPVLSIVDDILSSLMPTDRAQKLCGEVSRA